MTIFVSPGPKLLSALCSAGDAVAVAEEADSSDECMVGLCHFVVEVYFMNVRRKKTDFTIIL